MFQLRFLPATIGDSIWVTYGDADHQHHLLIDGGTAGTRNHIHSELRNLPEGERLVELMVVSHVDKDHIGGILTMLERNEVEFKVNDFWFNAFRHMPQVDDALLSVAQGERLTNALDDRDETITWNGAFDEQAVVIPESGDLPEITLAGGMKLTLLSPNLDALHEMGDEWAHEVLGEGLEPGGELSEEEEAPDFDDMLLGGALPDVVTLAESDFDSDDSPANGSSIAFLAEFEGKRVLFAADAHVPLLLDSLEKISPGEKLDVDLFKVSHHGSKRTISRELVEKVNCRRFAISTNGSIFRHPDHEAVARILVGDQDDLELHFNYRSPHNEIWDRDELKGDFGYEAFYPPTGEQGITIDV